MTTRARREGGGGDTAAAKEMREASRQRQTTQSVSQSVDFEEGRAQGLLLLACLHAT